MLEGNFRESPTCEVRRIPIPRNRVNKGKKRKGGGLASPLSPPRLLAVQSPTRLAVPRGAKPADTNLLGWVWTNVNLLPSGAMN
jgi:hypothetical protein